MRNHQTPRHKITRIRDHHCRLDGQQVQVLGQVVYENTLQSYKIKHSKRSSYLQDYHSRPDLKQATALFHHQDQVPGYAFPQRQLTLDSQVQELLLIKYRNSNTTSHQFRQVQCSSLQNKGFIWPGCVNLDSIIFSKVEGFFHAQA